MSQPAHRLTEPAPKEGHTKERARFWGVQERVMSRLKGMSPPVPVDDPEAMVAWYFHLPTDTQKKMSPGLIRRIHEIRSEMSGGAKGQNEKVIPIDQDYAEFAKGYSAKSAKDTDALAFLKKQRDFALFKIDKAQSRNDFAGVSDATKLLTHYSGVIHDEEIRADKLGRELGDILEKREVERILRAMAFWMLRTADESIDGLAAQLSDAAAAGPLLREDARRILEPGLLDGRVLTPLARAAQITAGNTLPEWVIAALRGGVRDTLEDADLLFASLYNAVPAAPGMDNTEGAGI